MRLNILLLCGLALALLQACVIESGGYGRGPGGYTCSAAHRFQVVDLQMSPDPVADGQPINRFRVHIRSDSPDECRTRVFIREASGNYPVARARVHRLGLGMNVIELAPEGRYRFERYEHCFTVMADIERSYRPVDAARNFCARRIGRRWTFRY